MTILLTRDCQDLALFCIERDGCSFEFVHAVAICNDRMRGVTEYHELDHAAETTVVRNTVGVQRVPWPKLSAEQERWDLQGQRSRLLPQAQMSETRSAPEVASSSL